MISYHRPSAVTLGVMVEVALLIVRDVDRLSRNDEELPGLIYTGEERGQVGG